jgi:peptidoglycan-N-acetylglucosamine deacetylase
MDPDSEAEQAASKIVQTIVFIVVFSACHYKEDNHTTTISQKIILPKKTEEKKGETKKEVRVLKKKKTIYLTFDDGPNKGTKNVIHIAAAENIPITMFLIGEQVYGSRWQAALYDSILHDSLVEVQNHSYTHAHHHYEKFYASPGEVMDDFSRCADSLGLTSNIIRTPGRNIWRTENISSTDIKSTVAVADTLRKEGYTLVGWDIEWQYDKDMKLQGSSDEMMGQIDSLFEKEKMKTPGHLVLLAHDQIYTDAADSSALHDFMRKLKQSDTYDFDLISNYPGIKN